MRKGSVSCPLSKGWKISFKQCRAWSCSQWKHWSLGNSSTFKIIQSIWASSKRNKYFIPRNVDLHSPRQKILWFHHCTSSEGISGKKQEALENTSEMLLGWDHNILSMCHSSMHQQLTCEQQQAMSNNTVFLSCIYINKSCRAATAAVGLWSQTAGAEDSANSLCVAQGFGTSCLSIQPSPALWELASPQWEVKPRERGWSEDSHQISFMTWIIM